MSDTSASSPPPAPGASVADHGPAAPGAPAVPPTTNGATGPDWTDQVTGLVVDSVDKVRSRTTGPIVEYSRASVHAIVALILALPLFVLAVVLAVRVLTYFVFRHVWITNAVLGTLLVLIGVVLWSKRSPSTR